MCVSEIFNCVPINTVLNFNFKHYFKEFSKFTRIIKNLLNIILFNLKVYL